MKLLSEVVQEEKLVDWKESGDPLLDLYLGKGIPFGRVIQIMGKESSGKTAISLYIMSKIQKMGGIVLYIDAEQAMEEDRIRQIIDFNKCGYVDTNVLENIEAEIEDFINEYKDKDIPMGILWDSLAQTTTRDEITENFDKRFMGDIQKMIAKAFRRIITPINQHKVFCIINNHEKEKMGMVFGNKKYSPGGDTKNFMYSIMMTSSRKSADEILERKRRSGIVTKLMMNKNKLAPREKREIYIPIFFDERFINEKYNMLENLLRYKIVEKTKLSFSFKEGEEKITFTKKEFLEKIYDEKKDIFIQRISEEIL